MPQEQRPPELGGVTANEVAEKKSVSTKNPKGGVPNNRRVRKPYRKTCITCD